jgi:hypothetical protein
VPTNGVYLPAANSVAISTNGIQRATIDSDGRLLINAATSTIPGDRTALRFQSHSNGITQASAGLFQWGANAGGSSELLFVRSQSGSIGTQAAVVNNAALARIRFYASDGTDFGESASIGVFADAAPTTGSTPGRLVISTTPSGSNTPTERMRLDSSGRLGLGTGSPVARLDLGTASSTEEVQVVLARQASPGDVNFRLVAKTGTGTGVNSEFFKLGMFHVNGGDNAFINFYRGGANTGGFLTFTTSNNSEQMRINAAGNVGIGTTSPATTLDVNGDVTITDKIIHGGDTNTAIRFPAADTVSVETNGTERARIDSSGTFRVKGAGTAGVTDAFAVNGSAPASSAQIDSAGRLLVGTATPRGIASGSNSVIQNETTSSTGLNFSLVANRSDAVGAILSLGKSRGSTIGSNTIVNNGDVIGQLRFAGADGTNIQSIAAFIEARVDGTPGQTAGTFVVGTEYRILTTGTTDFTLIGAADSEPGTIFTATDVGTGTGTAIRTAGDMPGRLVFSTTPDNSGSPTERLRITNAGVLQVADAGNITVGTTTGTKIGTATTQKLGFYNATPVVQPTAVADATDAATAISQLNALLAHMRTLGLIAT